MVYKKFLFLYNISKNKKGAMLMENQEEIWKDIVIEKNGVLYDYTGLYQVSNLGRVRSLNYRGKGRIGIMHPTKRDDGYYIITLHKNSEQQCFRLHRLVATAFLPNPDCLPEVNHKDENPANNCLDNVEWCTSQYNDLYGNHRRNLSKPVIMYDLQMNYIDEFKSGLDAERQTGARGALAVCQGKRHTAGGYIWRYKQEINQSEKEV